MAKMNNLRWIIVGLTAVTAVIHLGLFVSSGWFIMLLNGLGYIALLAALYFIPQLESMRATVRWALVGYTAVTIILYFAFNWPDVLNPLGLINKAVEALLILALLRE